MHTEKSNVIRKHRQPGPIVKESKLQKIGSIENSVQRNCKYSRVLCRHIMSYISKVETPKRITEPFNKTRTANGVPVSSFEVESH